jgi:hypothetical protein
MRKTIKNVMMVVPVLMTSCHVSLKLNIGPVKAPYHHEQRSEQKAGRSA